MGQKNRTEQENTASDTSSSLSEALLLAAMCIIGLPVDVHVRDGSVYSGIFYTTSVEKDFGIVLKKAKMTKKGNCAANVVVGAVIETLVILSSDLVEVVAKGVRLSANGVDGNMMGDVEEASAEAVPASASQVSDIKKSTKSGANKRRNQKRNKIHNEDAHSNPEVQTPGSHTRKAVEVEQGKRDEMKEAEIKEDGSGASDQARQIADERSQEKQDASAQIPKLHGKGNADKVPVSSSNSAACLPAEEGPPRTAVEQLSSLPNNTTALMHLKPDTEICQILASAVTSSSDMAISNASTSSHADSTKVISPQSIDSDKNSKEFKLNPQAKMFSPSFTNTTSAAAVPAVASMGYVQNTPLVVPIAAAQSDVRINPYMPRSSVPAKFVPYGNLPVTNVGSSSSQFSQPILGISRNPQPTTFVGQYPLQAAPAYVHSNPPAVLLGRIGGNLVYMQPISNGVAALSPASARPPSTPHQVQFPKHQGVGAAASHPMQLCMPSPVIANGQQPFAIPTHIPVLPPPIPANRPIQLPPTTGLYATKFQ